MLLINKLSSLPLLIDTNAFKFQMGGMNGLQSMMRQLQQGGMSGLQNMMGGLGGGKS